MRLFVALDIDAAIRKRLAEFRDQMRPLAPEVRWVGPETFHITLQFLGETKKVDEIRQALRSVEGSPVGLAFRGTGFFPAPNKPRVFWVGIEGDGHLQPLVTAIGAALEPLGFARDEMEFKPHLTLARAGGGRPWARPDARAAPGLQAVRVKLEKLAPPEFGTMTAREFCLYESKTSLAGAQYTKLERYPLG